MKKCGGSALSLLAVAALRNARIFDGSRPNSEGDNYRINPVNPTITAVQNVAAPMCAVWLKTFPNAMPAAQKFAVDVKVQTEFDLQQHIMYSSQTAPVLQS